MEVAKWARDGALALGMLCALGAEGFGIGIALRLGRRGPSAGGGAACAGGLGPDGDKSPVPRSGCCEALGFAGFWLFSFLLFPMFFFPLPFLWPLLAFCAAVVAGTLDVGAHVGVVAEAGWGVVDERAYLISHDGDGVLAE